MEDNTLDTDQNLETTTESVVEETPVVETVDVTPTEETPVVDTQAKADSPVEFKLLTIDEIDTTKLDSRQNKILRSFKDDPEGQKSEEFKSFLTGISFQLTGKTPGQKKSEKPVDDKKKPEANKKDSNQEDSLFAPKKKASKNKIVSFGDEADKLINEKYRIKDPSKFLSQVEKWRADSQNFNQLKLDHDTVKSDLSALPSPILQSIIAYKGGKDFVSEFNKNIISLDFSKGFDKQKDDYLLNHYVSELYEDLESKKEKGDYDGDDDQYNADKEKLVKTTKKLFEKDQESYKGQRALEKQTQKDFEKSFGSSIESSLGHLTSEHPSFSSKHITNVKRIMANREFTKELFNDDGTYKPEAAKKIAYFVYHEELTKQLQKEISAKVETETTEKIVDRSSKKHRQEKSTDIATQKAEEIVARRTPVKRKSNFS